MTTAAEIIERLNPTLQDIERYEQQIKEGK